MFFKKASLGPPSLNHGGDRNDAFRGAGEAWSQPKLTNDYQVISIIGFKKHKFMYTLYTHYLLLYFGGGNAHVRTN